MIEFISYLFIAFGILQIILFFKVWGMTNDVKKLTQGDATNLTKAEQCFINNNVSGVKKYLSSEMAKRLEEHENLRKKSAFPDEIEARIRSLERLKDLYCFYGIDIPSELEEALKEG